MPAVPKHRQPIVNTALTLFRRQGYSRTGLNEIVDVSGAPKGSLYHYFPLGKSSIAVAAVTEAGRRVAATLTKLVDAARPANCCGGMLTCSLDGCGLRAFATAAPSPPSCWSLLPATGT
jgi:hypothetical protein